jgi:hypothetical protein
MTNEEYLRDLLDTALQNPGENAFFVRQLREQLRSLEYFKKVKPSGTHQFHIGARGEASEDRQPTEYQEDIYGAPVPSPAEREGEEEES